MPTPKKKVCNFVGGEHSPLLANIALHGLEAHLCPHFPFRTRQNPEQPGRQRHWRPQIIRYADDLVVLHRDRAVIAECRQLIEDWLRGIGLELSEQTTRIAHPLEHEEGKAGFAFLGFTIRQHHASKYNTTRGRGFKTMITPSPEAVKRHWAKLSAIISRNKAAQQGNLLGLLNPVMRGWANYYSTVVSTKTFHQLDHHLYHKLQRWAHYRHPRKARQWIAARYWDTSSGRGWVFRDAQGPTLKHHTHGPITRHTKVKGTASPYNGDWRYWATRRGKYPGVAPRLARLLRMQQGRCAGCRLFFGQEDLLEVHHLNGDHDDSRSKHLVAIHRHCHDQIHGGRHILSGLLGHVKN